jgi:hypothetical protein
LLGGNETHEGLQIAVIGYGPADQVVLLGQDWIMEHLEPGWSTGFQIGLYMWGTAEKAVRYETRVLVR